MTINAYPLSWLAALSICLAASAAAQAQVLAASVITANIVIQNRTPTGAATTGSAVEITILEGRRSVGAQVVGIWTGSLVSHCTINSTTWVEIPGWPPLTANGIAVIPAAGCVKVRVSAATPITGTATVSLVSTD